MWARQRWTVIKENFSILSMSIFCCKTRIKILPNKLHSIFISMILFSLVNLNLALSLAKLSSKLSWVVFTCFDKVATCSIPSISNNTKMKLLLYLLFYLTLCSTIFFLFRSIEKRFLVSAIFEIIITKCSLYFVILFDVRSFGTFSIRAKISFSSRCDKILNPLLRNVVKRSDTL